MRQIENHPTSSGDVPTARIEIADCGQLSPDDPFLTVVSAAAGSDPYEDYPEDADQDIEKPEIVLGIAREIREIGNMLFKESKIGIALAKYLSKSILT